MAFRRNRAHYYICDKACFLGQMARIDREEDANKREIAIRRQEEFHRPLLIVMDVTRICFNCNQSIHNEITQLERDPACMRFNVLTQTGNQTCVFYNTNIDVHTLSVECSVDAFVLQDIYILEYVRSCRYHLDNNGFIPQPFLLGLSFINRPYVIKGQQLQAFLQGLRRQKSGEICR